MKAISIRQPYIGLIADEIKLKEIRSKKTNYRGDVLLCASKNYDKQHLEAIIKLYKKEKGYVPVFFELFGKSVCIAEIYDCQPMTEKDADEACIDYKPGHYSWYLRNIRPVLPKDIKANVGFFEVNI